MKNLDLDSQLKVVRVPERSEGYWQAFPRQVMAGLHKPRLKPETSQSLWPQFAWSAGLALACIVLTFFIGRTDASRAVSQTLRKNADEMRVMVMQLPDRLRSLLQDGYEQHHLVEDQQ